jgi:flagellar biosynthesis protein FlhA
MSIGFEPHPGKVSNSTIIGHSGFLFTLGTVAVAAGLLFPLSSHILDALLILNISLAIAVLIATFSARRPLEVSGFPLLILMLSMLQMAGNVASSKLILSQGHCGTIIGFVASVIVRINGILWIPVTVALVSVIFAIIYKVVGDIGRIVSEFSTDIVPAKQGSICNCLSAGVISDRQALDLRDNIVREDRLLIAMNGTAKFVLCAAIIGLASIIANIAGGPIVAAVNGTVAAIPVKTYIGLALSAGLIAQVCTLRGLKIRGSKKLFIPYGMGGARRTENSQAS